MPVRVFIGLGSNQDEPLQQLRRAVTALQHIVHTRLLRVSGIYVTRPLGPAGQADYLNAVAELETDLQARDLLAALQDIEQDPLICGLVEQTEEIGLRGDGQAVYGADHHAGFEFAGAFVGRALGDDPDDLHALEKKGVQRAWRRRCGNGGDLGGNGQGNHGYTRLQAGRGGCLFLCLPHPAG